MNTANSLGSLAGLLLALGFTLTSSGCSDSGSTYSEGVPTVEFLDLVALGDSPGSAESVRVVHKLTTKKPTTWKVEGAKQRVAAVKLPPDRKPGFALVLSEPEQKCSLSLPGPFDPQTFNLIALHFRTGSKWELSFDFMVDGRRVSFTPPQVITPESGLRTILIDAPHLRRIDRDIDEIVIKITGLKHAIWIAAVDLCWQADHEFLPTTSSGPQPVLVGSEMRNAVGVSTGRKLGATIDVTENSLLRFSYGIPGELTRSGADSRLELIMRAEDGTEHEQRYQLDSNFRKARWRQALVPLEQHVGETLELEWRVLSDAGGSDAVCALGEVTLVHPGTTSRCVIFITSDTHRGDHLGAAQEGVDVETPMLDALASRGVLFEDCFSATNITNPSHIALMTGVHPRDTGIVNNYTQVSRAAPTLAEAFRDAGYITYAAVSTRHLSDSTSGLGQGFERASYPMTSFAREGSETIEVIEDWISESGGLPLFIWLHLFDAHMPYDKKISGIGRYYSKSRNAAFDKDLPELGSAVQKAVNNLRLPGLRDLEFPRALYKAEITQLDEKLGDLLDQPIFDGSVIAFTADHGESLGNHEIYFAHEELYRESLHVPLILSWPGGPRGVRYEASVSNVNLGRTLLDLSGNLDVEFPGSNLALLVEGEQTDSEPRFCLSAHAREASVTQDGWHFQLRLSDNTLADESVTRVKHRAELYYLHDDPDCAKDLLEGEFERAKGMRELVLTWLEGKRDLNWIGGDSGDAETLAKLKALGYTGGSSGESASISLDPECDCSWCARFE